MPEGLSNWHILQAVLERDATLFLNMRAQVEAAYNKSIDIAERQKMKEGMLIFSAYSEAAQVYLKIMTELENETVELAQVEPEVKDGGTTPEVS